MSSWKNEAHGEEINQAMSGEVPRYIQGRPHYNMLAEFAVEAYASKTLSG